MALYDSSRVEKIAKITPYFTQVARVGDSVHMGLQGDPMFPKQFEQNRPMATITGIDRREDGTQVTLTHSNGATQTVSEYTISPSEVWEFTDATFNKVLSRERDAAAKERAETTMAASYRGVEDLSSEIDTLRAELAAERKLTRNFHNVYIATLNELTKDMRNIESGVPTSFARTFNAEYEKMRAESGMLDDNAMYRGADELSEVSDVRNDDDLTDFF